MPKPELGIRQMTLDEAPTQDPLREEPEGVTPTGKVLYPSELPYETQIRQGFPGALADRSGRTLGPRYDPPWNEVPGARWMEVKRRRRGTKRI